MAEETFDVYDSSRWKVSGNVARHIGKNYCTAFGATAINSGYHEWLVKYENTDKQSDSGIGVSSTTETLTTWFPAKPNSIGLRMTPNVIDSRINYASRKDNDGIGNGVNSGDLFRIQLDCKNKSVTFYQNDNVVMKVNDIPIGDDIKYRLAVSIAGSKGDKFTILESKGALPKTSLKSLSLQLVAMEQSVKEFEPKVKTSSIDELTKLQKQNKEFFDECKEFEQNYENLQQIIRKLDASIKQQLNPDPKNYKQWDVETICRYILSLEQGRYGKYIDSLKKAIEVQEIEADDLPTITANDLFTMGVTKLKDRKSLQIHLNNLRPKQSEGDQKTDYY